MNNFPHLRRISQAKQTFLYFFDYSDERRFRVRVHAINEHANPDAGYPRLVESVGEAPTQYPDWDDEEDG